MSFQIHRFIDPFASYFDDIKKNWLVNISIDPSIYHYIRLYALCFFHKYVFIPDQIDAVRITASNVVNRLKSQENEQSWSIFSHSLRSSRKIAVFHWYISYDVIRAESNDSSNFNEYLLWITRSNFQKYFVPYVRKKKSSKIISYIFRRDIWSGYCNQKYHNCCDKSVSIKLFIKRSFEI